MTPERRITAIYALALALSLGVVGMDSAFAQSQREIDLCFKGEPGPDRVIEGCTAVIEARRSSAKNRSAALNNRGLAYREKNQTDRAIEDYTESIRLDEHAAPYVNRGNAHLGKNLIEAAIADFDAAIRLSPKDAAAYDGRGNAYSDKGEFEQALRDYDESIRLAPRGDKAWHNRATLYFDMGDNARALEGYTKAISLDPGNSSHFNMRGRVYFARNELDRALADFDQAMKIRGGRDSYTLYYRGRTHKARGDLDRARMDFNEAVRINPRIAAYFIDSGNRHRNLGFKNKRQFDLAIANYDSAIDLDPVSARAYAERALAHLHKEGVDRAIEDYDRAVALDPNFTDAWLNRGNMYRNKREYDRAAADYDRALASLSADDETVKFKRATIFDSRCFARGHLNQLEAALKDCDEALNLQPHTARHNRAAIYIRLGRFDDAIAEYNVNLKILPRDSSSIYGRGLARLRKGDAAGGKADIDAALSIDPNAGRGFHAWYGIEP